GYGAGDRLGRKIDWTHDQHLASEWITARVPVYFKFRKSELRRERLAVKPEADGSIVAVNGLGADILQLQWADSSGKLYTAARIPAGAQAKLAPTGGEADGEVDQFRLNFDVDESSERWPKAFQELTPGTTPRIRPNSYWALLDAVPFGDEGLRDVKT